MIDFSPHRLALYEKGVYSKSADMVETGSKNLEEKGDEIYG